MKLPKRDKVLAVTNSLAEKGLVFLVLVYVLFSVGRSITKNYQMNKQIKTLEMEIAELDGQKLYLQNLITYYKTDTYKELKAREELGFQMPDEHVLSVPVEDADQPLGEKNNFIAAPPPEEKPLPNYQKWYNYFLN